MVSAASKRAPDSESFLWTFPECPVRIHVDFRFIERLRAEVLDLAPAESEVGGLLIGNELSPDGDIEISDYFRLPPRSESTKNFVVCSDSLKRAIQRWSAGHRRVIGFYRTHLEQRIHLRAEDLECIQSKFKDPANVFLVIRPHDGVVSAGFFYWQDGSVVGGLAFPFATAELKEPSWTTLVGGSPKESSLYRQLIAVRDWAMQLSARTKIGLAVVLAILIVMAAALRINHAISRTSPALGLRVERALLGVVVAWNPAAPEIAKAQDANLLIWDGSSPPAYVRLTTAQLRAGRTFFTSVSDRVEVRLDVIGTDGNARTESIVSVAHAPDLSSSEPPATGTRRVVPTQRTSLAPAERTSEDTSAKQPGSIVARVFAPLFTLAEPAAKPGDTLAELPQPPELDSTDVSGAALAQTFHNFTNPPTALPRYAPEAPAVVREPAVQQQSAPVSPPAQTAPVVAPAPTPSSFQAAVPIRETRPQIPSQLKTLVHGDNVVQVIVHISASGQVTAATLGDMKGPVTNLLSKLAVNAALGWQFRPATQNGEAVPSDKTLEFLFRQSSP